MKLTTGILAVGMMTGAVWAQSPNVINNVQNTMNTVQQQKTSDSDAALGKSSAPTAAKPGAGAPAKPGVSATAKPAAAQPVSAKAATATPAAAKSASANPASAKSASATPASAKSASAKPATAQPVSAKPATVKPAVAKSQPAVPAGHSTPAPVATAAKPQAVPVASKPAASQTAPSHPVIAAKEAAPKAPATPAVAGPTKIASTASAPPAGKSADAAKAPKPEEKKWAMTGKRDPFFSPVVQQPTGSGCSAGKKCLDIGQINLRGVVKSETGFIAVVTNSLNKAYFLRENDPVFNGYVIRITGDAVVFQETVLDKLGKPLTREVVKRIFTPAV